jgi:hexulose-6-phosphate isomerase
MTSGITRRQFLPAAAAAALSAGLRAQDGSSARPPRYRKALKYHMIREDLPLVDKFKLIKDLGFEGLEIHRREKLEPRDVRHAVEATGIEVHGVLNSADPDLTGAIDLARGYGATSVLVVAGRVTAETPYDRNYAETQKLLRGAVPHAERSGIRLLVENVWNSFLLSPLEMARYLDELESDAVGAYFDVGNVVRFEDEEHVAIAVLGAVKDLDLPDGFGGELPDGGVRVLEQGLRAGREDVVVAFDPGLRRQRVRGEHVVSGLLDDCDVLLDRTHLGIAGLEELADGGWGVVGQPDQFTDDQEPSGGQGRRPGGERVGEADVVGRTFRPEQIDLVKDLGDVVHVHSPGPHQVADARLLGPPQQVVQEQLGCINGVNRGAEFLRQGQRLAAGAAAGVDNEAEFPFRKQPQDVQRMAVVARAELFHSAEEEGDWIGGGHGRCELRHEAVGRSADQLKPTTVRGAAQKAGSCWTTYSSPSVPVAL